MILNQSEAAAHLGYKTRTTLQRLLRDGHLDAYRVAGGGRAVLLETAPQGLPNLREQVQALTQIRYDSPLWRLEAAADQLDRELAAVEAAQPDWELIAELLAEYLGPGWPAPPWDAEQANTLAVCLAMAVDAAAGGDG